MAFFIKQNDTSPFITATLKDASNAAVDISGATVQFHMRKVGETTAKVDAAAVVTDADNGAVKYEWSTGDTDTVGQYQAEFEVTYVGGKIETFPNNSYILVQVIDDIA